jgi:tRNA pseudouridine55 synthase
VARSPASGPLARRPSRSGILVVDKMPGVTSFQVVAHLKRVLREPTIGHGGTLDPGAAGVLPILIGEATKLMPYLMEQDKEYRAAIRLGITTDTQDLTGDVRATTAVPSLSRETIEQAARTLVGAIRQVPPMYSAVHYQGRRLYELARAGIEVERQAREVVVHEIIIEEMALPTIVIRVRCGKGTYIRTLAADLGAALGVGGAVGDLVRLRVGPFTQAQSVPSVAVAEAPALALWRRVLPSDTAMAAYPAIYLGGEATRAVLHGQAVPTDAPGSGVVRLYGDAGAFVGVGRLLGNGRVKPERILHADHPGTRILPA